MIRLVLVEDNEFMRMGLREILRSREGIELEGDFATGDELLANIEDLEPDIVLLGGSDTISGRRQVWSKLQNNAAATKLLLLSEQVDEDDLYEMVMSNVSGYVQRNADTEELVRCIGIVASGGLYFENDRLQQLFKRLPDPGSHQVFSRVESLTERESAVLEVMSQGFKNADIGKALNISKSTVKNCIAELKSKLGVDSRQELLAIAIRRDILRESGGLAQI